MIGDETYIDTILREGSSALKFDACLGARAMMPRLTKIARVLGPRGLMPNPKTGTLIEPGGMRVAIENMKKGRVQYRWVVCNCIAVWFKRHTQAVAGIG